MSIFGVGPSMMGNMPLDPAKLELAESQLAMLQTLHQSIVDGCQEKCYGKYYSEVELSKGEGACVDRCSSKFFRANVLISEHLQTLGITPESLSPHTAVASTLGQHRTLDDAA